MGFEECCVYVYIDLNSNNLEAEVGLKSMSYRYVPILSCLGRDSRQAWHDKPFLGTRMVHSLLLHYNIMQCQSISMASVIYYTNLVRTLISLYSFQKENLRKSLYSYR